LAGVAAVAVAGTAGYAVSAWTPLGGGPGPAGKSTMTTALDAENSPGGLPADADPATQNATSGASGTAGGATSGALGGAAGDGAAATGGTAASGGTGTGSNPTGSSPATGTGGTEAGAGSAACAGGQWQPAVQGRPAGFAGGDRAGDYLWHSLDGFHLRVTHRGTQRDVFARSRPD